MKNARGSSLARAIYLHKSVVVALDDGVSVLVVDDFVMFVPHLILLRFYAWIQAAFRVGNSIHEFRRQVISIC
jgi:hypothetical protein